MKVALDANRYSNDLWIAALVIQHDLILLTRDAHFKSVPQLSPTLNPTPQFSGAFRDFGSKNLSV